MSTTKRVSGVYTIATVNPTDQVNVVTPNMWVYGNLFVTGNTQSIVSTDTLVTSSSITLNNGVLAPNPAGANIIVARSTNGSSANVSIRWNETLTTWQLTNNGTTYANIASTSGTNFLSTVSGDPAPSLGGNLNLAGRTIWDSTSANVQLFTSAIGGGGTGLHVTNNNYANVEIISKTRSIAYSIIFG